MLREFGSFTSVGFLAALGHYGTLIAAVELLGAGPVPAAIAGFLAGALISYPLNRRWTFASERPHEAAVPRFLAVALGSLVLTGLAMAALADGLGLHYVPAQAITTAIVMLWSFLAHRLWTFGARPG